MGTSPSTHTRVDLKDRELATILAALRYWQREGLKSDGHEADIAAEHGPPLTAEEIDDLCEWLNANGVCALACDSDTRHRINKLVEKALEEVSIGNPDTAEVHLRELQSLVTPRTAQAPLPQTVADADRPSADDSGPICGSTPAKSAPAMTFKQFQATRIHVADLAAVIADARWDGEPVKPSGYVYLCDFYIEDVKDHWPPTFRADGRYALQIANTHYLSHDLESLERHLYAYAVAEGTTLPTEGETA